MKIGKHELSYTSYPYVIAEMSANHENSLASVLQLMKGAKSHGVSAFKLQTYTADSLTINSRRDEFVVKDGPWVGKTLYEIYKQGSTPFEWLDEIFAAGHELELEVFSTPFGLKEVELLESYNVRAYKIASFEITYHQLLDEVGRTRKPVILSTGMASKLEIIEALEVLRNAGSTEIVLLKCTTSYPASFNQLNLSQMHQMHQDFGLPIGFSDHTESELTGGVAVAYGATALEKHIKLDEDFSSLDSTFSLPVSKLGTYISHARNAFEARGSRIYGAETNESDYLKYRRSIIARRDIEEGTIIGIDDLTVSRPDIGLPPKALTDVLGCKTKRKISRGEGLAWEDLFKANPS